MPTRPPGYFGSPGGGRLAGLNAGPPGGIGGPPPGAVSLGGPPGLTLGGPPPGAGPAVRIGAPNFGSLTSADQLPGGAYAGIGFEGDADKFRRNLEKAKQRYKQRLIRRFGMNQAGAEAAAEVAFARQGKHRTSLPMSALGMVGRGFKAIEGGVSGGFYGFGRGLTEGRGKSGNPWDTIMNIPHAFGEAGQESWEAVRTGKGWGEEIKENVDPNAFISRHAGSVGLGASILFDPTTYLSFGATAGSKIAARRLLNDSFYKASDLAGKKLAAGGGAVRYWGREYTDHLELTQAIRQMNPHEYPLDLPHALDMLKYVGLERKAALRRFERPMTAAGETERLGPGKILAAYALPQAVKGGRGIRFGGMELPGTGRMTAGLASKFRGDVTKLMAADNTVVQGIASGFVTNAGLRAFGEDTIRALALTEMTAYRTMALGVKEATKEEAMRVARGGGEKPIAVAEREGAFQLKPEGPILSEEQKRKARQVLRVFGREHSAEIVPKDVMRQGQYGPQAVIDPKLYAQLRDETASWTGRDMEDVLDFALEPTSDESHILTVRSSSGSLKSVGSFSDFGGGVIHIDAVASASGTGDAPLWFKHLIEQYPNHSFEGTPANEVVERYYKDIGFKHVPLEDLSQGSRELVERGEMVNPMVMDAETAARFASGEHIFGAPELKASEPVKTMLQEINEGVNGLWKSAKRVKLDTKDLKKQWRAIQKEVDDPVEAYAQYWFKTQMQIRAREFQTHLLSNPALATKVGADAEVTAGYKIFKDKVTGQRYAVLGTLHDALDELVNPQVLEKSMDRVLHMLSIPQNYWKQFATSANPSFHVMNFLGAFWNNLYAGIYNPADYMIATATLYRSRMLQAQTAGRARYMGRSTEPKTSLFLRKTPEEVMARRAEAGELVKQARVRGATAENASIYSAMAEEGKSPKQIEEEMGRVLPQLPMSVREALNSLVTKPADVSAKRFALKSARRATAVSLAATGNVPLALALAAPEAAQVGRVVGNTIEDVVRLAPFMKAAKDPVLLRYMDVYGPIRVPGMEHTGYSHVEQNAMYDIGAAISKHFQFDYSDLTVFERRIAKLIFPFYTFNKKNFMLQMQLMAQAPRGIGTAEKVMTYANDNGDISPEFKAILPTYFDQIQAFQVPVPAGVRKKLGLPLDQPLFLNPKLPFMSLNLIPPMWQMFQDTGQPTNQRVLSQMSSVLGMVGPLSLGAPVKVAVEAAVGMSLGLNKPIDYQRTQSNNYRDSYVPAPSWVGWLPKPMRNVMGVFPWMGTVKGKRGDLLMPATGKYILDQMATPFITNLGQSIPYEGQDPEKARADMVSWMTGIRLIPVDALQLHRSYAYQMRSMLESRRQSLKAQGKELSVQDQDTLSMTRDMLKVLEEAWDTRDAELHGQTP